MISALANHDKRNAARRAGPARRQAMNPKPIAAADTVISDWSEDKAARFGRDTLLFRHTLHERPMFSDEALAEVLDRYPRERLGVFTMGQDLEDWKSWRRGDARDMSGRRLMEAVQAGRIWLNLREANAHLPEYAALCDEISAEKERHIGVSLLKRDLGLLISSPGAMVFYHLDVPLTSLWHIRGDKRVWFYPRTEPFISDEAIERCITKEAEGQFAFRPEWDADAHVIDMKPGDMATWAQISPSGAERAHRQRVAVDGVHDAERPGPRQCALRQCAIAQALRRQAQGAGSAGTADAG